MVKKQSNRRENECPLQRARSMGSMSKLPCRQVPEITEDQIEYDRVRIGRGAFSEVHRVRVHSSKFKKGQYYALKCLNSKSISSEDSYDVAAFDLAMEADLLARLNHPNVIRLQGVASDSTGENGIGYFLLLDLLDDTLTRRLRRWRSQYRHDNSLDLFGRSKHSALRARIDPVVDGVVRGMEYLHQQKVILRDLKPDNIGFASDGNVKIFDFGLAREVHTFNKNEIAGSYLYMAPECMPTSKRNFEADFSSDVYSFGVMLWEMCTLHKPFHHCHSRLELIKTVVFKKWRPSVSSIPSKAIRKLITKCWDDNPDKRPDFANIHKDLEVKSFPTIIRQKINVAVSSSSRNNNKTPLEKQDIGNLRRSNDSFRSSGTGIDSFDEDSSSNNENEYAKSDFFFADKGGKRRTRFLSCE